MTAVCPSCTGPVTTTSTGALLDAEPTRLGVLGPDGEPLPVDQVLTGLRAGEPVGRKRHVCPPPGQGELFAVAGRTDKTRGGRR